MDLLKSFGKGKFSLLSYYLYAVTHLGPRELGGAIDLISQYKLWPLHEHYRKKSIPLSISESNYLKNVVGVTEIRKGEGMEINQLVDNTSHLRGKSVCISPFDLDVLREAFRLNETGHIDLPSSEKGVPTAVEKSLNEKERKCKKHKTRDTEKGKSHRKHKHHHNKDKSESMKTHPDSGVEMLKQDKKRRHDGSGECSDISRHKIGQPQKVIKVDRNPKGSRLWNM
ncbi:hypothetical protein ACFE04_011420 [Oxalis oulophora]